MDRDSLLAGHCLVGARRLLAWNPDLAYCVKMIAYHSEVVGTLQRFLKSQDVRRINRYVGWFDSFMVRLIECHSMWCKVSHEEEVEILVACSNMVPSSIA